MREDVVNLKPPNNVQRLQDLAGSFVDIAFLCLPAIYFPFNRSRRLRPDAYERELSFYIDNGYCDHPESFFVLPKHIPPFTISGRRSYGDGYSEKIVWQSGFTPRNPHLREHWARFEENRTAVLIRWTHGRPGNKMVVCLHGFMLGDPAQAERMFRVRTLFDQGLDIALFITPFHWRRAPKNPAARGMFLQPGDVCMTAEAIHQTMHDLFAAFGILKHLGALRIGLIGASLGGYHAALFSCLADLPAFCAMMVPAVGFKGTLAPGGLPWLGGLTPEVLEKARRVWEFTSPLHLTPTIDQENILLVASRGDRLCPAEETRKLAAKWPRARTVFMTGGHWLMFNQKERGRAWYRLLTDNGFIPAHDEPVCAKNIQSPDSFFPR